MIHAGNFTILVLRLLDGMRGLDSDCLNDDRVSNITTKLPDGDYCPEALNYTSQYCQCCHETLNRTHRTIEAARNSSISFANTEDLQDIEHVVSLVKEVLSIPEEIVANIRNCTGTANSCFSLYEEKKKRNQNYTETYKKLQGLLGMARTSHDILYYCVPPLMTIVFLCGMIGNGTLLYIFYRHPETRSGPKILLVNLAISDILLLLFNFFVKYYFRVFPFTLGKTVCHILRFVTITPARASILTIMVLSITRYIAVTAMPGDRSHKLLDHMPVVVTLVWTAASLEAIQPTLESVITKYDFSDKTHCDIFTSATTGIVMIVITCFLPFAVIGCFALATYWRLRGAIRKTSVKSQLDMAKERNVKILPAIALFYTITYPPFYIFALVASIHKFGMSSQLVWFFYLTQLLLNMNSALNPLVLYLSSAMFREYFDKYLRCKKKKVQQRNTRDSRRTTKLLPHSVNNASSFKIRKTILL